MSFDIFLNLCGSKGIGYYADDVCFASRPSLPLAAGALTNIQKELLRSPSSLLLIYPQASLRIGTKTKKMSFDIFLNLCGSKGIRTPDPLLVRQML